MSLHLDRPRAPQGTDLPSSLPRPCNDLSTMASVRDSLSEEAQADCDGLLNHALSAAQQFLEKRGEFYPFAFKVASNGEVGMGSGDPGEGEHPMSTEVLELIYAGLRSERDSLRATAVVADVRHGSPPGDAIR